MATTRSVNFLPPIFQTPVNTQFLNATLDQLIQEPKFKKISRICWSTNWTRSKC